MWGEELLAAGFAHHGGETMVSGVTGEEFAADIFVGLVYYQRLRHMVSDKFQVRATRRIWGTLALASRARRSRSL